MTMSKEEAVRCTATIAAYFPGSLPVETMRLWAKAIERFTKEDVEGGIRRMAEQCRHPSLCDLIECVRHESHARHENERVEATKAQTRIENRPITPEEDEKRAIARKEAAEFLAGVAMNRGAR